MLKSSQTMKKGILLGGLLAFACNVGAIDFDLNFLGAPEGQDADQYLEVGLGGWTYTRNTTGIPFVDANGITPSASIADTGTFTFNFNYAPVRAFHIDAFSLGLGSAYTLTAFDQFGAEMISQTFYSSDLGVLGNGWYQNTGGMLGPRNSKDEPLPPIYSIRLDWDAPVAIDRLYLYTMDELAYVNTPDGGATALLLAGGVLGLVAMRRRH